MLDDLHWLLTFTLGCSLSYLAGRYGVQRVLIRKIKKAYLALLLAWAANEKEPPPSPLREDDD